MMASWDDHLTERCIPAILPRILRSSGFAVDEIRPFTFCDHLLKPDGLASLMMQIMKRFALENGHMSEDEATAWFDEQIALAAEGRFLLFHHPLRGLRKEDLARSTQSAISDCCLAYDILNESVFGLAILTIAAWRASLCSDQNA